jgi:hypothetical protein
MTSRVTVLMVAEKPMLADSIAKLLSDKRANKRRGLLSSYHFITLSLRL